MVDRSDWGFTDIEAAKRTAQTCRAEREARESAAFDRPQFLDHRGQTGCRETVPVFCGRIGLVVGETQSKLADLFVALMKRGEGAEQQALHGTHLRFQVIDAAGQIVGHLEFSCPFPVDENPSAATAAAHSLNAEAK